MLFLLNVMICFTCMFMIELTFVFSFESFETIVRSFTCYAMRIKIYPS